MIRVVFLLICVTLLCGSALARALAPDTPACPKPTITALGPTTFCQGGSVMLSSSQPPEQWTVSTLVTFAPCGFNQNGLCDLYDLDIDTAGNLYLLSGVYQAEIIHKITPAGKVTPVMVYVDHVLGGVSLDSFLFEPVSLAVDIRGNIYFDVFRDGVYRINPSGHMNFIAGGFEGYADGKGQNAAFDHPGGISIDKDGNVILADLWNYAVRKIAPDSVVTTIAGGPGMFGYQDGTVANALLFGPLITATDTSGNIYLQDAGVLIRKITKRGIISTLAGNSLPGYKDGIGKDAGFADAGDIASDAIGNIYVSDSNRIRKITPNGLVTTIAGQPDTGHVDGPALLAKFNSPGGICVSRTGTVYVADHGNNAVRMLSLAPSHYLWNTGDNTQSIKVTKAGIYSVRTIANGCTSLPSIPDTVSLLPLPAPLSIVPTADTIACSGHIFYLQASVTPNGEKYLWSTGDTAQSISVSNAGKVTLQAVNANGCKSASSSVNLHYRMPRAGLPDTAVLCANHLDSLTYTASAGEGTLLQWSVTGGNLLATTKKSALVSWSASSGEHLLMVVETDSFGCSGIPDTLHLIYNNLSQNLDCDTLRPELFIPNVFTPGGYGPNEQLFINGLSAFPSAEISIFNRWGKMVFHATPYRNDWAAEGCPAGTYYYLLTDGRSHTYKGWVQVVK